MNKTLIVMPTYNERDNLPRMAQRFLSLPADLLVVDDNSPDGTGQLADELATKHSNLHVLHRQEKNGLGRAYIAGFKWALAHGYERIFEMDADFSHDPDDLLRLDAACADSGQTCLLNGAGEQRACPRISLWWLNILRYRNGRGSSTVVGRIGDK